MTFRSALASSLVVTSLFLSGSLMAQDATFTLEHAQGKTDVPRNPQKVIVLNPATLDNADALGIPVMGVPKNSTHLPAFLAKYQGDDYLNAGTLFEPDYEALINAKPDLIIAGGRARDAYDKLSEIAPTIALDVDTAHFVPSLTQRTNELAAIFGKEAEAKALMNRFQQKIDEVKGKSAGVGSAMVIMINGGKMSAYTPAPALVLSLMCWASNRPPASNRPAVMAALSRLNLSSRPTRMAVCVGSRQRHWPQRGPVRAAGTGQSADP